MPVLVAQSAARRVIIACILIHCWFYAEPELFHKYLPSITHDMYVCNLRVRWHFVVFTQTVRICLSGDEYSVKRL